MKHLKNLLSSPEYYPVVLDTKKRMLRFVPMSRESYRDSVFLDLRTRTAGTDSYEIRLDDLLMAAAMNPPPQRRVHYIMNTGFCCSTLLARYFELLPSCLVLKEPRLLAQLAGMRNKEAIPWEATLDLCLRLLSRTFAPNEIVVMKPVECCSPISTLLLELNDQATMTFLMTPLRQFLLALLKSGERRDWARLRMTTVFSDLSRCPPLADVESGKLTVAQSIACLWLIHRFFCQQLCTGPFASRVVVLNGQQLVDSPETALTSVLGLCGLDLNAEERNLIVGHPTMRKYSKDQSRPYDAESRSQESEELERCWGAEADAGQEWAVQHGCVDHEAWTAAADAVRLPGCVSDPELTPAPR